MKQKLILVLMLTAFIKANAQLPFGASDSTYFILPDGTHDKYYYQRDVAVFRLAGGAQYTGTLPPFVTAITWLQNDWHGYNLITFDTSATGAQCQAYSYYLAGYPGFEYGFVPVTRNKIAKAYENRWKMLSDLIVVKFRDHVIDNAALSGFIARNNLDLYHRPDSTLPDSDTWAWIFQLKGKARFLPLPACADIFTNEAGYVTICEPDIEIAKADTEPETEFSCTNLPNEFAAWGNTAYPDALWHIKNNGNVVNPYIGTGGTPLGGIADADAKICDCWGEGYDGTGVKIAVIDDGGIWDYNHPNLLNQILPGYNFNMMQAFSTSTNFNTSAHGMRVASVIAGLPNAGQTTQPNNTTVVGVAFGAKIIPYVVNLGNATVVQAIQKAITDGASIVNMSWSSSNANFPLGSIHNTIEQAVHTGRNGLGMVFVGSVGNDNADVMSWPAIMKNVIGVGASDPFDYRGSAYAQAGVTWDWLNIGGGSNYHDVSATDTLHYDVIAPGTMMFTDQTDFSVSPPSRMGIQQSGTSFATPLVAGIAAMYLQKFPYADFNEVTNSIVQNADKVRNGFSGPGTATPYNYHQYSAFLDGYAKETFYGRVNCLATITKPVVGLKGNNKNIENIENVKLAYLDDKEAMLLFDKDSNHNGSTLSVYDLSGRQLSSQKIEAGKSQYAFNTEHLKNGVYLLKVTNSSNNPTGIFKYIK